MSAAAVEALPLVAAPAFAEALRSRGLTTVGAVFHAAEWVRRTGRRANLRLPLAGTRVHVKVRFRHRGAHGEVVARQWAREAGLPVAAEVFRAQGEGMALIGLEDLAPREPLDALLRRGAIPPDRRAALRQAVMGHVARLHAAGLHHRDLYLNHLFVDPAEGAASLVPIDLERMGRHRQARSRWVIKDLAALRHSARGLVSDLGCLRALVTYARLRGWGTGVRRLARRVERKARRMARHTPRTPVGDAARPTGVPWP